MAIAHPPYPFSGRPRHVVLAALACCLCAGLAHAQQDTRDTAEPVETLPEVVIEASTAQSTSVTKTAQTLKETPQSVTVIDRARMQEQNLQSLDDVMQAASGVTVRPYIGLTTSYSVRGFQVDSFEQDGVPVLMGNTASPPRDMAMYERVEILRGANGLLHGSGNPAATVNLVPKRPQREFGANASVGIGSWQRYRGDMDIGGPLNAAKSLRGRVVVSHEDRGYFYDVAEQQSSSLYAIGELDLTPATKLAVGIEKARIRSITNMAGVPFYSDGTSIGLPRSTYLDVAWDRFDWDTTRIFADLEHVWDSGWKAKVTINRLRGDSYLKYAGANGAIDPATGSGSSLTGAAYRFDNQQDSMDGFVTGPFTLLGRQHELLLGGNYQRVETEQFAASFLTPVNAAVDVFNWDPHSIAEPEVSAFASRGPTRTTQSGLYGVARLSLTEPLKLVLGGRISRWKQEAPTATYQPGSQFTPHGGLVYELTPQWSAYASYAQVFQPQTQMTWSGDVLDPVEGDNYEAGIKGELADGRLNVSLAAFEIRQKNRAQQDPEHPCVGTACYYIASGEVRSRGFEAEATGHLSPDLNLSASYTFNTTKYVTDASSQGQPFARYAPKHMLRVWGNYTLPVQQRRWSVGLGTQAQSEFSVVSGGATLRQGGYAIVNLRVGYRINRHANLALNVGNLFDRTYYQSLFGTAWSNRYGEPRSAMLTLRAQY